MSDLNSFGGGVDHDPGEEDKVRLELSRWFKNSGADVYWDRDHSYGWGTFDPGTAARPDLIVMAENKNYALEVKPGGDSSKIHDALPQLVNYWVDVVDGKANYTVAGKRVEIDAFLLATDNSPMGRLYQSEGESDVLRSDFSEGRMRAVSVGQLPQKEFNATERIVRALWRFSKDRRPTAALGIGALLSSRLDGDSPGAEDSHPAALYKSHGGQPNGNNKRHQWWEYIPFYQK